MRKSSRILVSAASGLLLATGGLMTATTAGAAETGNSSVQACYDGARSYSKASGARYYPNPGSYLTTTSACNDINIKPKTDRYVAVCFKPSSGSDYCQGSYKLAKANQWTAIATDVTNGTRFYFDFRSTAASNGSWAA
ncbi:MULTISPECIES: hypothetical protein [Streptomyces violaceusniger group]|uniref:Secreted protein n=2 Tax=Streptomyces javensis TaxID=114698 RepID=A0ABN1XCG9_9ACTN|nr:hypothetical protein [Streptomyces javensis]MBI0319098.1 hypothetical protein [Streptomyces javensis]